MTLNTTVIKRRSSPEYKQLFESAMLAYRNLLPEIRERDQEEDIAQWLSDTWNEDGHINSTNKWINALIVQHVGDKIAGLFWCNLQKDSGIGFVAFWGMLEQYRSNGGGMLFAKEVIALLRKLEPNIKSLIFATERVDWPFLDEFRAKVFSGLSNESAIAVGSGTGSSLVANSASHSHILEILKSFQESYLSRLLSEIIRYRRLVYFAAGFNMCNDVKGTKAEMLAYVRRQDHCSEQNLIQNLMGDFVQPPIREPVDAEGNSYLWLFCLKLENPVLQSGEAVDWVYDVYLKEYLGKGRTQLLGWNEYMIGFKRCWRDAFALHTEPRLLNRADVSLTHGQFFKAIKSFIVKSGISANPV